jgi:hypothetical protein
MLAIVNVSDDNAPAEGVNSYEVRINNRVIAKFEHSRAYDGAAECLRDAADAVERCGEKDKIRLLEELLPVFNRMNVCVEPVVITRFRLLNRNEKIQSGDEFLTDDAETWAEVTGFPVGMNYDPAAFQPIRRAL